MLFKGDFQGLPSQGGWWELETSSAARGGLRSPRSLLSSSLQPDVGKCSKSVPALSSLLLPTFLAADLSWAPSLSATCPGAPSKAACMSSCLEKEQGGRKGMDSVGRARQRRGVSVHPAAWGKGKRMFCNIWRALPGAGRGNWQGRRRWASRPRIPLPRRYQSLSGERLDLVPSPAGAPLVSCRKNVLLAGIWQPGLWRGGNLSAYRGSGSCGLGAVRRGGG